MTEKGEAGKQWMKSQRIQGVLSLFSSFSAWPWKWLLAGLFIRLVLMPIAVHSDFIHTWWASACMAGGQAVPLRIQTLLFGLHTGYQQMVSSLLPDAANWCTQYSSFATDTGSFSAWFTFIQQPQIFRTLWLLKLPYLFFDIGCAVVMFRLGATIKQSRWLMIFWWLNPLTIYAIYIIGRHESITIFFILLSLLLLRQKHFSWGFVILGLAIALRYYPLFLLPFFIFSLPATLRRRLSWAVMGLGPWLLVNLYLLLAAGRAELTPLLNYSNETSLLSLRLYIGEWDWIYLMPLAYFLLLLHRLYNAQRDPQSLEQHGLMAMLLMLGLTPMAQAPHYWVWMVPFMGLYLVQEKRDLWLHAAQIGLLLVVGWVGNRAVAGYLFAAIAPDFFWSLPGPAELIRSVAPVEMVFSLAQTGLTAISLWMIYILLRQFPLIFPARSNLGRVE